MAGGHAAHGDERVGQVSAREGEAQQERASKGAHDLRRDLEHVLNFVHPPCTERHVGLSNEVMATRQRSREAAKQESAGICYQ